MLFIRATKGFEIGSRFGGCEVPGSIYNDPFIPAETAQRLETGADRAGLPRPKVITKTTTAAASRAASPTARPFTSVLALSPWPLSARSRPSPPTTALGRAC